MAGDEFYQTGEPGWGIYNLNGGDSYVWLSKVLFIFGEYAPKNAGLQRSTLSSHRMTTSFGPFELLTCGLLQKGWDHFPPKACFDEPSSRLAFTVL